jgi:hypothetical protein
LDSFNKFSKVLTYELPNALPTCGEGDHKIKVVHGLNLPFKAPYSLNQKELKEFKKNLNTSLVEVYLAKQVASWVTSFVC